MYSICVLNTWYPNRCNLVITCGTLPSLLTTSTEEVVRREITVAEGAQCLPVDISRKNAIPTVKDGFEWDGNAVKGVARQGAIYVCLTRDLSDVNIQLLILNQ